jgi:hypothetical protein
VREAIELELVLSQAHWNLEPLPSTRRPSDAVKRASLAVGPSSPTPGAIRGAPQTINLSSKTPAAPTKSGGVR